MRTIWEDARFGARMLVKKPGFTLIAVITLGLGIGAVTTIFSVVDAVLLRPLPYAESERLALYNERSPQMDGMSISWPNYTDWRAQQRVFEEIGRFNRGDYNPDWRGRAGAHSGRASDGRLFTTLRVQASHGTRLRSAMKTSRAGRRCGPELRVSQRRFAGDPQIVGKTLASMIAPYTVIGVMPQGFRFPSRVEMWVPVGQLSDQPSWKQRGNHPGLHGVARLKPGVTIEQAPRRTWTTSPPAWRSCTRTATRTTACGSCR